MTDANTPPQSAPIPSKDDLGSRSSTSQEASTFIRAHSAGEFCSILTNSYCVCRTGIGHALRANTVGYSSLAAAVSFNSSIRFSIADISSGLGQHVIICKHDCRTIACPRWTSSSMQRSPARTAAQHRLKGTLTPPGSVPSTRHACVRWATHHRTAHPEATAMPRQAEHPTSPLRQPPLRGAHVCLAATRARVQVCVWHQSRLRSRANRVNNVSLFRDSHAICYIITMGVKVGNQ